MDINIIDVMGNLHLGFEEDVDQDCFQYYLYFSREHYTIEYVIKVFDYFVISGFCKDGMTLDYGVEEDGLALIVEVYHSCKSPLSGELEWNKEILNEYLEFKKTLN